jgi:hypothetical protein
MVILDWIFSLIIGGAMTLLYFLSTRKAERRRGLFWVFLLIFLGTWAGGIWMKPFGPVLWGVHWLAFLLIGIIIALVLAVTGPRPGPRGRKQTINMLERVEQEKKMEKATYVALGLLFWILFGVLVSAILVRYVLP